MAHCAFAYLRVSSEGQVKGHGFDRQREAIQRYADEHGIQIEKEFADAGVSGVLELEEREALVALVAEAEQRQIQLVLVERPDRLARDHLVDQLILKELRAKGIRVFAAEGGRELTLEGQDPQSQLIQRVMSIMAQFEKDSIVHKLRKARERKKRRDGRCEGAKPFGFYSEERAAQRRVLELATKRLTLAQIAQKLDEEGFRPRSKKKWSRASVWKIIQRARRQGELDG